MIMESPKFSRSLLVVYHMKQNLFWVGGLCLQKLPSCFELVRGDKNLRHVMFSHYVTNTVNCRFTRINAVVSSSYGCKYNLLPLG